MTLTSAQRLERLVVRLTELQAWRSRETLPLSEWTFAGEALAVGSPWPSREGVVTLEHPPVEVPAGWALEHTRLDLNAGGESFLKVRYDGSEENFGLTPYHEQFPLTERRFSLELHSVARLPFGVSNPNPRLERAQLLLLEPRVVSYLRLLEITVEALKALGNHEVVPALLTAAEDSLALLCWPSATAPYLARMQGGYHFSQMWQAPQAYTETQPLTEEELESVTQAQALLQERLQTLKTRYPHAGKLILSGHAHIDLAWLWPLDETRRKAQRTFSSMTALMRRYPEFKFNQSSAQFYAFLEDDDPTLLESIKEHAQAGQWETVGGMWVEPDTIMPTGESLVRQLLYGQRYFQKHFDKTHTVAWLPDCFGFSPALPQLLRLARMEGFFTTKTNWNETNRFPYDLFEWEGLDGSRVLGHSFWNPSDSYNAILGAKAMLDTWEHYRGKYLYPESLLTIGYGDGGGGTTAEMLERQRLLNTFPALPEVAFDDIEAYYSRLRDKALPLPHWYGEIYLELHRGTLTSQGRTKRLHRQAERELLAAEVLSSLHYLLGGKKPESLEPLWRVLLRNQFHDILPGSSIREVYELAEEELTSVVQGAQAQSETALDALSTHFPQGDKHALLVVNPDMHPRPLRVTLSEPLSGAQETEEGYLLASGRDIPGLGVMTLTEVPPLEGLSVSEEHLENHFLRVDFANNGSIARIRDKLTDRQLLAGRGNQLWAYVDKPRAWDAWDVDIDYAAQGEEITQVTERRVLEDGLHRAAVRITRRYRDSTIRQDIRLWANSGRLEFRTYIDWHERRLLLKARFPLNVRSETATFESAFGVIRRPTHRNTSWEQAQFEVVGHRFVDLSEPAYGVALLNDGRYGHHALGNELGLSLLRSPVWPDALADESEHSFTYALYPHTGDWHAGGVLREAEDLNRPLFARSVMTDAEKTLQPVSFVGIPLALGALKVAEDDDSLILRVYEPQGGRGHAVAIVPQGWALAAEMDLLEGDFGKVNLNFEPFKLHSWRLRRG